MGRVADRRDRCAAAVRPRLDVRPRAADLSGTAGPPRRPGALGADDPARSGADHNRVDRRRGRARLRVRPALPRFSVCRVDHGGGAVFEPDAAQSPAGGRTGDRGGGVCLPAGGGGAFACLLAGSALYTVFNEGSDNWQSLWTCAIYFLLGVTLWQARAAQIPK